MRWVRRPIDKAELAITHSQFIHFDFKRWFVAIFSSRFGDLFGDPLRRRTGSLMDIICVEAIESHSFDDDFFTVGGIFNKSVRRKDTLSHGDLVSFCDGPEII